MKIVSSIRESPPLTDIVGQLRKLANDLESAKSPAAERVIVVVETTEGEVVICGYGAIKMRASEVGLLHMAAIKLATL